MTRAKLGELTIEQLVARYVEIGTAQDEAMLDNLVGRFNQLYDRAKAVEDELQRREGDQRRALLALYGHANWQVRLNAAQATRTVAPQVARRMIEEIADSRHFPQAGHTGMALYAMDRGIDKPG
ncbi:DUF2019 domain-containing protein [Aurantimonas marina]|uniref:DUF2019 domain-containing protein n=1 Tax=Aurantimonas marina TaxID=2780508 RepID=UPI0019D240DF|nr:DUF2019 domain-containing protein [Aurantimonas marina]